eukprot:TRINITY_DN7332_c0_g2_i1.p1 TRINITY_DN7332_c0_g2~~TRINITY_DN7332_c0_g2_i1.p1  ORF type:complete len:276 (-),score=47.18 TRINITY_DN7332_c0_g2_i1:140-967(-)
MSRHSKNNTAAMVFTHHERSLLKYGTISERIGAESIKPFDACSLCIHPVIEPVSCPEGHIFCKECIYQSLLSQKKEIARQMERWEETERKNQIDKERQEVDQKEKEKAEFEKINGPAATIESKSSDESKQKLTAFWVPGVASDAIVEAPKKPSTDTMCPEGNHPVRLKKLIPLNFSANKSADREGVKDHIVEGKYQCPSCCKTLTNVLRAVVLTTCGHVVCTTCWDKIKKDTTCFVCAKKFKSKHVVKLQCGGTGYSESSKEKLKPKAFSPTAWL